MTVRIGIIEDNADLALGLRRNLEYEGYEVLVANDGDSGLDLGRQPLDLLILDVMLPGRNGFEILRALRGEGISIPVLLLTARGEETDKVRGLLEGADDYVTKPFGLMELLARVAALLRRTQTKTASGNLEFAGLNIDIDERRATSQGVLLALTPKEFDLLVFLASRPGHLVGRATLLREVWGHSSPVASRTVDTHVAELRKKLPASTEWIETIHKSGYRFLPLPERRP